MALEDGGEEIGELKTQGRAYQIQRITSGDYVRNVPRGLARLPPPTKDTGRGRGRHKNYVFSLWLKVARRPPAHSCTP